MAKYQDLSGTYASSVSLSGEKVWNCDATTLEFSADAGLVDKGREVFAKLFLSLASMRREVASVDAGTSHWTDKHQVNQ